MLQLYASLMNASKPVIRRILLRRGRRGREDILRLGERMGLYEKVRPLGPLVWLHAASVGEAQSTLILIDALQKQTPFKNILVTTGTVTSARLMEQRLPAGAFHQYYPVDHPRWVTGFLDHWQPDFTIWMESELWPNMLQEIGKRNIPAALVNARLSEKSFRRWRFAGRQIRQLLDTFDLILAQTRKDAEFYNKLGARAVSVSGNLKYSAAPLPCDPQALLSLQSAIGNRPLWLYASTHAGEEDLACRVHRDLKKRIPDLLTIVVPRHPERGSGIKISCEKNNLTARLRSIGGASRISDDIYIADTLGEMGLLYRLTSIACIGRSFSSDGGGGHNPIEAAQLGCAVLHGPDTQNFMAIYTEMDKAGASLRVKDEEDLKSTLERLLENPNQVEMLHKKGSAFVKEKSRVLDIVMDALLPLVTRATAKTGGKTVCG